ncbi:MAG TPA: hypothetical protein PKC23_06105 [Candidatus Desulfobacillus sp.]|nr:hypothetical protein [Candidatus Desulfobacillus sp.]
MGANDGASPLDSERFPSWLAALPQDSTGVVARALTDELHKVRDLREKIPARLRMLETCYKAATRLVGELEKRLGRSPLPLAQDLQSDFIETNVLLKALASAYTAIVEEFSRKWINLGYSRPFHLATVRSIRLQALRIELAYRVYARGSAAAWTELHRLYRLARMAGLASRKTQSMPLSVEQIYVGALLLDFAEPNKFAPGELGWARFYVERHARFAVLEGAQASKKGRLDEEACFLVKPGDGRAGRALVRAGRTPIEAGDMILNCGQLLARMQKQIAGLEKGKEPAQLGLPLAAHLPQYRAMMQKLHRLWSTPPLRRYGRQKFKPRVDLVVGFDPLWSYLSGPAGRRRNDTLLPGVAISEWAIGNESPDGFFLQHVSGNTASLCVGELVGLRARDKSTVFICLARRVVSSDLQSLELGLQNLASGGKPTMASIESTDKRGRKQARTARVIILARLPGLGDGPALIAPARTIASGMSVCLQQRGATVRFRMGQPFEQSAGCEVFSLAAQVPAKVPSVRAHPAEVFHAS